MTKHIDAVTDVVFGAAARAARKPVQHWRYSIPVEKEDGFSGWAVVFMDENGCFSVVSDYGDYGHHWPRNGFAPQDFRAFILQCDGDYIRRKIAPQLEYWGEGTLKEVRSTICRMRREGLLTRDRARKEWGLLARHDNLYSEYDFVFWGQETTLGNISEISRRRPSAQVTAFIERTLPRLKELLRADLFPVAQLPGQS